MKGVGRPIATVILHATPSGRFVPSSAPLRDWAESYLCHSEAEATAGLAAVALPEKVERRLARSTRGVFVPSFSTLLLQARDSSASPRRGKVVLSDYPLLGGGAAALSLA